MKRASVNLPYLVLTGVLIGAALLGTVMFTGQWQTIRGLQAQQAELSTSIADREEFVRSVDQKIASLQSQTTQENELAVVLPADAAFDDFLRVIERLAGAAGVSVDEVNNSSDSAQATARAREARGQQSLPDSVEAQGASLSVAGNYQQIRQFIRELENSPRLIDVQSVRMERNDQQIELLGAQILVRFYSFNPS